MLSDALHTYFQKHKPFKDIHSIMVTKLSEWGGGVVPVDSSPIYSHNRGCIQAWPLSCCPATKPLIDHPARVDTRRRPPEKQRLRLLFPPSKEFKPGSLSSKPVVAAKQGYFLHFTDAFFVPSTQGKGKALPGAVYLPNFLYSVFSYSIYK